MNNEFINMKVSKFDLLDLLAERLNFWNLNENDTISNKNFNKLLKLHDKGEHDISTQKFESDEINFAFIEAVADDRKSILLRA